MYENVMSLSTALWINWTLFLHDSVDKQAKIFCFLFNTRTWGLTGKRGRGWRIILQNVNVVLSSATREQHELTMHSTATKSIYYLIRDRFDIESYDKYAKNLHKIVFFSQRMNKWNVSSLDRLKMIDM